MSFYTKLLALRTAVDDMLEELDDSPKPNWKLWQATSANNLVRLAEEKKAEEERDPPESK